MVRAIAREGVACACGFNWCALVLLIFASASGYWSWGIATAPVGLVAYTDVRASTGPWLAGSLWSTYPVPCNCVNGFCYSWCYVGSDPVSWGDIPAEAACGPQSLVYAKWSGPLGYCSFPGGAPPLPGSSPALNGTTGQNTFGNVPAGTVFNVPSQVPAVQGLIVTSTLTVFFAALAGCVDAGMEGGNFPAAGAASFCSLLAWVLAIAAYSVWSSFPYVQNLQGTSPSPIWVPVWVDQAANQMTAVQTFNFVYGPGWATALTASILIFFCNVVHCVSMVSVAQKDMHENVTPQPRQANGGESAYGVSKV